MRSWLLVTLVGFGGPICAQSTVSVQYTAANTLTVAAGGATNTLPAGTVLTAPSTHLDVASPVGLGGAVLHVTFGHSTLTGTSLQLHESSNMQTPYLQAGTGPNQTVLVLTAQQAVPATVELVHSASSPTPSQATSSTMVDIGDDGSFELSRGLGAVVTVSQSVTIPPQGLRIRTVTQNSVTQVQNPLLRAQVANVLQLTVVPDPRCDVQVLGGGCIFTAAPRMSGQMTFAESLLLSTQAFQPNVPVWTLIGARTTRIQLPGGLCELNVVPVLAVATSTDPLGNATQLFSVPANVSGTAHFQQVILGGMAFPPLTTTNGVTLRCP